MRRGVLALLGLGVLAGALVLYLLRPPAASTGPVVGKAAPEITGRDLATGRTLERLVSGMRGKPFALLFFTYGCGSCREEVLQLRPNISKFKAKGFEIFLVTQGEEGDIAFVRDNRLLEAGLNVVLDPSGAAFNAYRIQFVPATFFVDRSGILRKVVSGWWGDGSLREFSGEVDFLTSN